MIIKTEELTWSDLKDFNDILESYIKNVNIFIGQPFTNLEGCQKWYVKEYIKQSLKLNNRHTWLMLKKQGKNIGVLGLSGGCDGSGEITIAIKKRYRKKGYGALFLLLAEIYILDRDKTIDYLYAEPNKYSKKIFIKAGYTIDWYEPSKYIR